MSILNLVHHDGFVWCVSVIAEHFLFVLYRSGPVNKVAMNISSPCCLEREWTLHLCHCRKANSPKISIVPSHPWCLNATRRVPAGPTVTTGSCSSVLRKLDVFIHKGCNPIQ